MRFGNDLLRILAVMHDRVPELAIADQRLTIATDRTVDLSGRLDDKREPVSVVEAGHLVQVRVDLVVEPQEFIRSALWFLRQS